MQSSQWLRSLPVPPWGVKFLIKTWSPSSRTELWPLLPWILFLLIFFFICANLICIFHTLLWLFNVQLVIWSPSPWCWAEKDVYRKSLGHPKKQVKGWKPSCHFLCCCIRKLAYLMTPSSLIFPLSECFQHLQGCPVKMLWPFPFILYGAVLELAMLQFFYSWANNQFSNSLPGSCRILSRKPDFRT